MVRDALGLGSPNINRGDPTPMDRTVIVTGGAGGMGLATARIMGRDHHVVLTDVREDPLASAVADLESSGIRARYVVADITDRGSVDALFATSAASAPRTRGGARRRGESTDGVGGEDHQDQRRRDHQHHRGIPCRRRRGIRPRQRRVHRRAHAAVGHGAAAHLPAGDARRRGVHPQDDRERIPRSGQDASRFGVFAEQELRHPSLGGPSRCVRCSGCPHLVRLAGIVRHRDGPVEEKSGSARLLEFAALKRFGRPDEIAELLAFCAGDKPSYLTGTDILCDGGTKAGLGIRGMLAMTRGA